MGESSKAVFLSYASQDAEAARRICEALRAAGVEVWFDQSELRGGDAWDRQIRRQIHECALFIPVISAHTQQRLEGYFRREWRLAVDRTHDMADSRPFLLPVTIDGTTDHDAEVPEMFRGVQWTRLIGGETPESFCNRVAALLAGGEPAKSPPHALPAAAAPEAQPRRTKSTRAPPWPAIIVLAVLAVVAVAWLAVRKGPAERSLPAAAAAPAGTAATATMPATPAKSIAVLPFVDMSERHDQEYFSDGLSEELIDRLSHNVDLKVIARTSSFAFKGKNEDMRTIAKVLGVAHLLEGSVRKSGAELRVTAQLIRASDGVHLWSETYERKLTDVFKVQSDIAAAVAKGLQAQLLPIANAPHAVSHNIEAYSLYLRGQYFARRASDVDVAQGIEILKQAIALEPDFAPAHAELADAYIYMGTFGSGDSNFQDRAREEVDVALRLDPTLRSARNIRVNQAFLTRDWAAAKAQLDELLASGPNDPEALFRRGLLARALGHKEDALGYFLHALQLDPMRVLNQIQLAMLLDSMRRPAEARAAAESAIAVNPSVTKAHLLIGLLDLDAGNIDAASAAMERETGEYYRLEGQAIVAFARKRMAESDAALRQLIEKYHSNAAIQIAQAYAYRGERDQAFEWIDRAIAQRDAGLVNVMTDPLFANLRGDPRFKTVLRRLNLPV